MSSRRIAVIGSGVAGLTAGYVLARTDDVTLFEADDRLGGHAHTHLLPLADGREVPVDTGFIVHNERTYPLLTRLFTELGVTTTESEMSMSVRCAGCGLQYAGQRGPRGLAAGVRHGRGRYLRMLGEVLRFHRSARSLLGESSYNGIPGGDRTLGEFLAAGGYSRYFITHFAMPFVAAVWSCSPETALSYPARYLFRFLDNHGLLSVTGSPPWRTVAGGSRSYVERVAKQLSAVRAGARVRAVRRFPGGAEVRYDGDQADQFDAVVVATHPDQALRLLADPTAAERAVLGAFRYSHNATILHTDPDLIPASPAVRASWNYALPSCAASAAQVQVSYYLNRLQRLSVTRDYIVTLGGGGQIRDEHVLARMDYEHPIYDPASVAAQRRLPGLNDGVTAYAGAYHGWGFHEDGCRSGVAAAASLGGRW
ncbi:MAG: FAD-dependent oxidoreductase [Streptosporangiaceae bacterium]|jgi:predicted NAD/FAD-binding protein